ncbi:hypothetical protein FHY25_001480 [Xanthomonas arboricola]|nr:hypothetical protein [Xanthomonas campestris]MCW2006899.1 hypothetical protein [Xanthomonas campestris]
MVLACGYAQSTDAGRGAKMAAHPARRMSSAKPAPIIRISKYAAAKETFCRVPRFRLPYLPISNIGRDAEMPEIVLNRGSRTGWVYGKKAFPSYPANQLLENGERHRGHAGAGTQALIDCGGDPSPHVPALRRPIYRYVDTGESDVSAGDVLWSDLASWCTIVALWRPGNAGLAHIVPGGPGRNTAATDTQAFLNMYGVVPREIVLATSVEYRDYQYGIEQVKPIVRAHYGAAYDAIKVYIVSGYNLIDWSQRCKLGCDPRSGPFPELNA